MAKLKLPAPIKAAVMRQQKLDVFARESIVEYGTYTIEDRAVFDYRDGFKPVSRRILWAMYKLGLKYNGPTKKSARIVGDCFAAGTPISTPNGDVPIELLAIGDLVNTSQGIKKVIDLIGNTKAKMFKLVFSDERFLVLTENQEVKIEINGEFFWKPACDLTEKDQIVIEYF